MRRSRLTLTGRIVRWCRARLAAGPLCSAVGGCAFFHSSEPVAGLRERILPPLEAAHELPRLWPRRVAGDKGYSSPTARRRLRRRGITPVIPTKKGQPRQPDFDRQAYRERNRIERLVNRRKQFRRIATRYEKRAINYLAMLTVGMSLLWL